MSHSLIEIESRTAPAGGRPDGEPIDPVGEAPIRAELYGLERLEALAVGLAGGLSLAGPGRAASPLLRRFAENEAFLAQTQERINEAGGWHESHGLDAEWLADNFHIIEEVLREVRRDLPAGYDEELPKLAGGPLREYPRVYALALSLIAHTDSELDEGRVTRFVRAFQGVSPLTIGELWALPTMLRLVLLENLRRLSGEMLWGWDERTHAERWAARLTAGRPDVAGRRVEDLPGPQVPADPFVVRLVRLLRDGGGPAAAALRRVESRLAERGVEANEVLRREHRRQASNQMSVGNCVTSLRYLSALDWNVFFERNSAVEVALRADEGDCYARQDFATRDRYRRAVEEVSRQSGAEESAVARRAVELAAAGRHHGPARGHLGYYLVGPGRKTLRAEFGVRTGRREALTGAALDHPRLVYFGAITALTLGLLAVLARLGLGAGFGGPGWWLPAVVVLLLLPAGDLAVGLVNNLVTLLLPPRVLAKLDFKDGIPPDCTTFVVMPTMLVRPDSAAALLERLEIHYLANPDPQLRFALLTDFADAPREMMPEDEGYLRDAMGRLTALNERYRGEGPDKFFLFHRRRVWNEAQNCWMGWERKRGKLSEFNRLLRGDFGTNYVWRSAEPDALPHARFVITLDADTQMPRDTAGRLIGAIAHPLNSARFDPQRGRVVEGYGVLQPRVSFHLTAATHSRFAGLLATSGGIDPYSSATSDAYMDLFGIGSFTGKGVYDVDAFEAATGHTFPENRILSHDLIEGNYARCGLLSDTELFDDFPARYHAFARREHRWVRGDWQLLPWLRGSVPTPDGGRRRNPLPAVERWKVYDNLRRSLVPPALVALLALGWTALPGPPWFWTAVAVAVPALPLLQMVLSTAVISARSGTVGAFKSWQDSMPAAVGQVLLSVVFMADQARTLVDAVSRTLVRLAFTRRNMLEWETAAAADRRLGHGLVGFALGMWPAPALAVGLGALVAAVRPEALWAAGPVLLGWLASPLVAFWVSRPRRATDLPLGDGERRRLRRIARKTWLFFETFVGDDDQWLPPDNFQEVPDDRVAHRTSPTNQGLLLLSTLAAHDLGYVPTTGLADRLEKTFETFDRMEKYWGHFFNWYDTRTLKVLPPAYVSTVDSGNLLGCLVALKQGLKQLAGKPLLGPDTLRGLADTRDLARRAGESDGPLDALLRQEPQTLSAWSARLKELQDGAAKLVNRLGGEAGSPDGDRESRQAWARRLLSQVQAFRGELAGVAPWVAPLRGLNALRAETWLPKEDVPRWAALAAGLDAVGGLAGVSAHGDGLVAELLALEKVAAPVARVGLREIAAAVRNSTAGRLARRVADLAARAEGFATAMDFRPLYKADRHLYAIGYNLKLGSLDNACYDLLASESCLTSFLTIARGEAPRRHWFQLGRPFIRGAGRVGLISWGGTMFEYLMPRLLMRSLPGTLVDTAIRTAVARQVEYGRESGTPWGISESAYFDRNIDGDYQYQAFGVPGLGLKRGLEKDLVIAPYATAMASMTAPREALENFRRLAEAGGEGRYGFYEAIDYTPQRVPQGGRQAVVRSYMAHHQGMSLVALSNAVLDDRMPRRFHAEPMVQAVDLLLQERVPRDAPIIEPSEPSVPATAEAKATRESAPLLSRRLTSADTPTPRTHLLSNGQYHVMVTNSGSGYSTCKDLDVTRWREDSTRDAWGQYYYVRDPDRGHVWSAGHQPVCRTADDYEVVFAADKATIRRRDAGVETLLEMTVSPEQCAEVRRLTLTNLEARPRTLEVTSYVEVALAPRGEDQAHPAFAKLFLETEWLAKPGALLCRRRPRRVDQAPVYAVHVAAPDPSAVGSSTDDVVQYETDRARFLGRGRSPADPAALDPGAALSGTTGAVLDPILSLRVCIRLEPGGSAVVAFTTAVVGTREEALSLADQYHGGSATSRAFDLAWAHTQLEHRHRGWSAEDAHLFQRLASHLIFAGADQRADPATLAANRLGQPGLWRSGISGDLPIVLALLQRPEDLVLARQLLVGQSFLRLKGLKHDLVLLDDARKLGGEPLRPQIEEAVRHGGAGPWVDKPGGVFVRQVDALPAEELVLLKSAARVVLGGDLGPLSAQLDRTGRTPARPALLSPGAPAGPAPPGEVVMPEGVQFPNGYGGFSPDGREYWTLVAGPERTNVRRNGTNHPEPTPRPTLPPAPWINVVANPEFGFLVSEAGSGYTWSGNSQMNRLTPWNNDPVSDSPGEVLYLRDEETGEFWTPTPLPVPAESPTLVRHGRGYTTFQRQTHGLDHELTLSVAPGDDPVKLLELKVTNPGPGTRRLSATYYLEWVLGTTREASAAQVVTELDPATGALLARNAFRQDFKDRVTFVSADRRPDTVTADRSEFLGRNGSTAAPAALTRVELSGRVGAGLDPCAALQVKFRLGPGETQSTVFLLGEAETADRARDLLRHYRAEGEAARSLARVKDDWHQILDAVQVQTPERGMDLMLNGWLLYQVLSCRLWGRSALYQSGGAFGFRDQLQDVMALLHGVPRLARGQILLSASRQFLEGDVQHWWHPPAGQGVRTHCSDDYLWLPYAACHYARTTGDLSVFDEPASFLTAPALKPDQGDDYRLPGVADERRSLYDHCKFAVEHGFRFGSRGLPLMGSGDWNDGMNLVGAGGRGESVWVAWFLADVLREMTAVAESRGDSETASRWRDRAETLRVAIEATAWDGDWYRRAYFDDGTPLGSAGNDECQIDSLAQTWAVISGAAEPDRARRAFEAVRDRLVREQDGTILLFDPPFDKGKLEPGYIKGYLPGVRENGGQYTHAATWVVLAAAELGLGTRASELFKLLNPVHHAGTPADAERYHVEPYVIAADVYGRPPHVGRGGWTWYTGSAGWFYRVGLEAILGFRRSGRSLQINPCIPSAWPGYTIVYRFETSTYSIRVENPHGVERGVATVTLDGITRADLMIPLEADGGTHEVVVRLAGA